jgi:peptidoglycan-associated lipoprotein
MNHSSNKYFVLLLATFLPLIMLAQRKSPAHVADGLFARHQYYAAIDKYRKAFTKIKNNREEKNRITYRLADCYYYTENYRRAEGAYRKLVRFGWAKKHPEILLHLADVLKIDGKFEEAIKQYKAYAERVPDDPRGKLGMETTAKIQNWIANPSKYKVTNVKKLNSREADFAPAFLSDNYNELVFTSTREGVTGKAKDQWTGQYFSDLFTARKDRNGEWTAPVLLDKNKHINTEANEGAALPNSRFNTLYFTRCPQIPDKKSGCQIYVSRRIGRNWGQARRLIIRGVDTTQTVGQPALSSNGLMLYFSSDRKGGQGGKDLWVSIRTSKNVPFGHPVNLGPLINTKGNEMFPFLRGDTALYFASDGHGGMGGLDIFESKIDSSGHWGKPVNLKYPINSTYDDFGIIFHPTESWGYLSSNRKGGRGKEDIYYFIEPPLEFTLSGIVTDNRTTFGVSNAKVQLIGSDGVTLKTLTNDKGFYSFSKSQVKPHTDYEIKVSKDNYFNSTQKFSTRGITFSKDFKKNIVLKPISQQPMVLPDILYDLNQWRLKPQFQDSLQGLIQTLRDNPNLVIELGSHTDSRASTEYNDVLSQKRARSVVNYLIMRGIDARRLVAKGYGERVPRTLSKDIVKNGFLFKKGTTLSDAFINTLPSKAEKEAAYALNRRTDFRVLRKDFVPQSTQLSIDTTAIKIAINPNENSVPFTAEKKTGLYQINCLINGYAEMFVYERTSSGMISLKKAMELLKDQVISKQNFEGNVDEILKNNSIADHAVIRLDQVRIANKTVKNVRVIVNYRLNFDMVFGDYIMRKFGKYHFNTQKHLLIFDEKK